MKVRTRGRFGAPSNKGATSDAVEVPEKVAEPAPSGEAGKAPASRFVGAAAVVGVPDTAATPPRTGAKADTPTHTGVGQRRVSGRFVILLVVIVLLLGGAGAWFYKHHTSSSGTPSPAAVQADVAVAARVGLQRSQFPGWTTPPGAPGNAFAPVVALSPAAAGAASNALTTLARCLHVPVADVTGAFGGATTARAAQASTPAFTDPSAAGTSASSVVDVMQSPAAAQADFSVFSNAAAFATCYQAYALTILPYTRSTSATPFTAVTVQASSVPTPTAGQVHAEAFLVTRSRAGASVTTTAVAVSGGRIQATLALDSAAAFPAPLETSLVTGVEARVATNMSA